LDEYLRAEADSGFSGSVLVAQAGTIVLDQDYGAAASIAPRPAF
jgi:hypothetical protein